MAFSFAFDDPEAKLVVIRKLFILLWLRIHFAEQVVVCVAQTCQAATLGIVLLLS